MESSDRFSAFFAYIPVIGWIYVLLLKRQDALPMFHVRQSIGLFILLAASFAAWVALTWVLGWIPFGFMVGVALFTMVITVFIFGIVAWVTGIIYALRGRIDLLPLIGKMANNIRL
jgi:Chloroplast import component protein (Tic20).